MWFPVDWLHTPLCLAQALSFAHHPLSQSESLSDIAQIGIYEQIYTNSGTGRQPKHVMDIWEVEIKIIKEGCLLRRLGTK